MTLIPRLPAGGAARRVSRARAAASASILVVAGWALSSAPIPPAYSLGTQRGAATVIGSNAGTVPGVALTSGNGATTFSLQLPTGAVCPGDSANDGYRVQSYMVPASVDPATLTFDSAGPVPQATGADFRQPLYDTNTSPFVDYNTAPAVPPPGPGPIVNLADFNYEALPAGGVPPGTYNIGIACTLGAAGPDQLKDFWNVQKTFTTSASGGAAQVEWTVAESQTTTTTPTTTPGATSTTGPGGTTSTARVGTTSTTRVSSSSTTTGGSSTTTLGGSTTTRPGGSLARTGGGSIPLVFWAVPLLILGRMAVLVARGARVRTGRTE